MKNLIIFLPLCVLLQSCVEMHSSDYGALSAIKRSVDARGMYVSQRPAEWIGNDSNVEPSISGPFDGNCHKFAKTYRYQAEQAGYVASVLYDYSTAPHAYTLVYAKDGIRYRLDNQLKYVTTEGRW